MLRGVEKKLLLNNPGIRTILLSATFESKSIEILKKLFSDGINGLKYDAMNCGMSQDISY